MRLQNRKPEPGFTILARRLKLAVVPTLYISALHEVHEKMARLFHKLAQSQLTNIDIQWPQGTVVDAYPVTVPDLYAGEPLVIKARLKGRRRPGQEVLISG